MNLEWVGGGELILQQRCPVHRLGDADTLKDGEKKKNVTFSSKLLSAQFEILFSTKRIRHRSRLKKPKIQYIIFKKLPLMVGIA